MARDVLSFHPPGLSRIQRRELAQHVRQARREEKEEETVTVAALPVISRWRRGGSLTVPGRSFLSGPQVAQPAHQATSGTLAGIYPFLTSAPVPPSGALLGIDLRSDSEFSFDPWVWYNRGLISSNNILVQGGYRQGKSFCVKRLLTALIPYGAQSIITSDPKGEHVRVAERVGGQVIRLGAGSCINVLERGHRRHGQHQAEYDAMISTTRIAALKAVASQLLTDRSTITSAESTALEWALEHEINETEDNPTLGGIYRRLAAVTETSPGYYDRLREDSRDLVHALRQLVSGELAGMFDGPSTIHLDVTSPYTVFDTSELFQRGGKAFALSQLVTNTWVQSVIADKSSGRRFFVAAEEGWAEMNSLASLEALRLRLKLSGEYGICVVMIVHEGGDFAAVGPAGSQERQMAELLVRSFANKITFRQEHGQLETTAPIVGFTPEDVADIRELGRGEALVKIKDRTFLIDTVGISSDFELDVFDTDTAMRGDNTDSAADEETATTGSDGGETKIGPKEAPVHEIPDGEDTVTEVAQTRLMHRCPDCFSPHQDGVFCEECGRQLRWPACPTCGADAQETTYCTQCGEHLNRKPLS